MYTLGATVAKATKMPVIITDKMNLQTRPITHFNTPQIYNHMDEKGKRNLLARTRSIE